MHLSRQPCILKCNLNWFVMPTSTKLAHFLIIYMLIYFNVFFFIFFCMHQKNERYILRFSVWSSKYGSAMYYLLDTAINDEHTTWWYRCCCWKTSTPIICDQICMQQEIMYFFHTPDNVSSCGCDESKSSFKAQRHRVISQTHQHKHTCDESHKPRIYSSSSSWVIWITIKVLRELIFSCWI